MNASLASYSNSSVSLMVTILYLTAHLSIGSSTGAATSGLNTKQVIEEGTNEVVVQKHSTGGMADQE